MRQCPHNYNHLIGGGRVLELGVPKIYVGSKCAKHTRHANSRGVWRHAPPGKLGIRRLNLGAI